jgi:hypothetical protein
MKKTREYLIDKDLKENGSLSVNISSPFRYEVDNSEIRVISGTGFQGYVICCRPERNYYHLCIHKKNNRKISNIWNTSGDI